MSTYRKFRKLLRMGPVEITGRLAGEARNQRLKYTSARVDRLLRRVGVPSLSAVDRCVSLVPGTARPELASLRSTRPESHDLMRDAVHGRASQIMEGRYKMLGKPVSFDPNLDWHADATTGFAWDRDFFGRVSYHKIPEPVDFKDIWELGRQQYVVELSRSWLLSGEQKHGDLARKMILSWIDGNPFCEGIHWTSGLEVAVRSISWIWTLANLAQYEGWQPGERERILQSLALHAYYLEHRFSFYESPYNHIIGEAAGLYLISLVLADCPLSERWRHASTSVLHSYAPVQFYDDGYCIEQAMGYHYFTLGFLILAELAARNQADKSLRMRETISEAIRTGCSFRQPDGTWPVIGDVDSALAIPIARQNYWNFDSIHRLAAVAFDDPSMDCRRVASVSESNSCRFTDDDTYWLLGCDGLDRLPKASEPTPQSKIFESSGYFVASDGSDFVLLDAGPIAGGVHRDSVASVAHGHADTLQVLYQFRGQPVLVDSGTPNYAGNRSRAKYFRSPQAHNCVEIEGAEVVRYAGPLAWSNEACTPTLVGTLEQNGYWAAAGRIQWSDCSHVRHILAIPDHGLWVADWLQSETERVVTWYWQFHNEISLELGHSEDGITAKGNGMSLHVSSNRELVGTSLVQAEPSGNVGWISPGYGVLSASSRLTYQATVNGSLLVLTRMGQTNLQIGFEADREVIGLAPQISDADASVERRPYPLAGENESPENGLGGRWVARDFINE